MPSVENTGIYNVSILCYSHGLNLYTNIFTHFCSSQYRPLLFGKKKFENNKANIIKFRWMLIWAFWGYSTFCNLLVLEQSGIKTVAYFTSILLVTMPYFWPTSKKTTMCSFLCAWTNFHQGQMILCIATANLFLFMDFFSPPHWSFSYTDKKGFKLLSLRFILWCKFFRTFSKMFDIYCIS